MALWICTGCTTAYSVGAARCPQCGGTEHVEEGAAAMPKITVHGGPSVAGASVTGGSWSNEGDPDVWPEPPAEEEGGEESSPGSSSETSPEKPPSEPAKSELPSPSPAPTTASRSKKARTGSRSARSTDGGPTADTSASND